MNEDATQIATGLIQQLESAWNAGDGQAFGRAFAEDADFVDIRADHHKSRAAIAAGHQDVLDTIYKGSTVRYQVLQARLLAPGVLSAQVAGLMQAPAGPFAGENRVTFTLVARPQGGTWLIDVFHNTLAPRR